LKNGEKNGEQLSHFAFGLCLKNGEKNGEQLSHLAFGLCLIVSDVSGRYSLGTNPRGVKDI
jgi:hypothetical protein